MNEEKLINAFLLIKQDISNLNFLVFNLQREVKELKNFIKQQNNHLSTFRHINSTNHITSTHNTTVPQEIEGLRNQISGISTGNRGVSTDRQTDSKTDNTTHFNTQYLQKSTEIPPRSIDMNLSEATSILNTLDSLKKEIRQKFKKITPQEMAVFSTIYQFEEQIPDDVSYKQIAMKLKLSESSIRDYVQRMIHKGIPIIKQKINNKKLILSISPNLRKMASLQTIMQLRDL